MAHETQLNQLFRWECGLGMVLAIGLAMTATAADYLSSPVALATILVGFACGGLSTFSFFQKAHRNWRRVGLVIAKIIAMITYLYAVNTIVSDILDHIWRSFAVAPTFLFYLGTILVFIGILPGYFCLILAETNSLLRMLALFVFYYVAVTIPNMFGFGKIYVSYFDAINIVTFVVATALVIIAMNHWGVSVSPL